MLLAHLILSLGFFFMSFYFKRNRPKTINSCFGYRTTFSMKNQETWNEGNRFSTEAMFKGSILNLVLDLLVYFSIGGIESIQVEGGILVLIPLVVIIWTEIHLRNLFDPAGNKINS